MPLPLTPLPIETNSRVVIIKAFAIRYGTADVRQLMTEALAAADLSCVTEADFRAKSGLTRQNIDHVCLSPELASMVRNVRAWVGTIAGLQLSDHNGITVELDDATFSKSRLS